MKNNFFLHFHSQRHDRDLWPFDLKFVPQLLLFSALYVFTKWKVSTAFLFREKGKYEIHRRTDGRGAILNAVPMESRIIMMIVMMIFMVIIVTRLVTLWQCSCRLRSCRQLQVVCVFSSRRRAAAFRCRWHSASADQLQACRRGLVRRTRPQDSGVYRRQAWCCRDRLRQESDTKTRAAWKHGKIPVRCHGNRRWSQTDHHRKRAACQRSATVPTKHSNNYYIQV